MTFFYVRASPVKKVSKDARNDDIIEEKQKTFNNIFSIKRKAKESIPKEKVLQFAEHHIYLEYIQCG